MDSDNSLGTLRIGNEWTESWHHTVFIICYIVGYDQTNTRE